MSSNVNKIHNDINWVIGICQNEENCPFYTFERSDETFSFTYSRGDDQRSYSIVFSDSYPDSTSIMSSDGELRRTNDRLPLIFLQIAEELWKPLNVLIPDDECVLSEHSEGSKFSMKQSGSNYTDFTSDDYDEENDSLYSEEEDLESLVNPQLWQDIESVKKFYGEAGINYRIFKIIDDIDVDLNVDMTFLEPELAKAWRVIREEPVIIRMHFSLTHYLDNGESVKHIEVFQHSNKEKFGLGKQLQKILETFVSKQIKEGTLTQKNEVAMKSPKITKNKFDENIMEYSQDPYWTEESTMCSCEVEYLEDSALAQLIDFGFSFEMAKNSLAVARGNMEEALNLLLANDEDACQSKKSRKDGKNKLLNKSTISETPASTSTGVKRILRNLRDHAPNCQLRQQGVNAKLSNHHEGEHELNLFPGTTLSGITAKQVPSREFGFLVQLLQYAQNRIPTLNEFCVVCDEPHVFQNGAMLKPAVCARELCAFAFETLGVMADAAEDIATGAEVVDLLIAIASAACHSHRRDLIFDPYPTVVDPENCNELALTPKKKDFKRVERALDNFPQIRIMTKLVGPELKREMDKNDILSFPLLQWIISSNRSHIVKLTNEKQIGFMHTHHQFLLLSSPPAKEAKFRAAKCEFGSTFAFHGSHIENWHSIMRVGLLCASGTKFQLHGAAYGKGIYLSPHSSISFSYSNMGHGSHWPLKVKPPQYSSSREAKPRFLQSKNLTCIALCEVITSKQLQKHSNIWVCPNTDHVCTRFFFVYEDGQVGDSAIDTQVEKYQKEILKAMENSM